MAVIVKLKDWRKMKYIVHLIIWLKEGFSWTELNQFRSRISIEPLFWASVAGGGKGVGGQCTFLQWPQDRFTGEQMVLRVSCSDFRTGCGTLGQQKGEYLQLFGTNAHPDAMRITSPLLLLFVLPFTFGTGLDFIADWLKGIGISYVAPLPRQGTCRDCSRSTLVSARLNEETCFYG